jgi:molybdopterin/thiamine biosynthesis adenylyltransferase/nitroreductase
MEASQLLDLPTAADSRVWSPVVLDPAHPGDAAELSELRADDQIWAVHDTLAAQLEDLASTRAHRPLAAAELDAGVAAILDGAPLETFGRWIFYPWSGRLVRTLPEEEFRELRLDRNRHKITDDEQAQLGRLTVGIVGLSVGNAVALTLTLEGTFGTLKLADFDRLDLSNLNRLRAGIQDIGVHKAELAARQIAEIDPYARVEVFPDGVNAGNVDEFLGGDSTVDVLVEECDSFDVKLLVRERARELGIPVLMETSDRGTLDVERFDIEPDRPIFHGLAGSLTAAELATLSFEEQLAAVLPIIGANDLSPRLAASMIERGQTVSTWPQLASDVTLGGATVATAVRRVALGQPLASGRLHVDLEELAEGDRFHGTPQPVPTAGTRLNPELTRFVAAQATLAPSGGNAQPWLFYAEQDDVLHVVHDFARSPSLLDSTGHASHVALGAALENIAIAAAHKGHRCAIETFPDPAQRPVVATVRFTEGAGPDEVRRAASFDLLAERATNRRAGTRLPIAAHQIAALEAAAGTGPARLQLHTDADSLDKAAQILGEADRIRLLNPQLHRDAMDEFRWSDDEVRATHDGIDLQTLELAPFERALFEVAARPEVAATLHGVGGGAAVQAGAWKAMAGASAVGLVTFDAGAGARGWLEAGRAVQRVWLAATRLGLGFQPMSALVFMLDMLDGPAASVFSAAERSRLESLGQRTGRLFPAYPGSTRALLFRLTHAPAPARRSLRLPVEQVFRRGTPPSLNAHPSSNPEE